MKSKLNSHGVYVNCKVTEIEHAGNKNNKLFIKVANCDDGYRCSISWEWGMYSVSHPIIQDNEVYPTEKDAVRAEINKTMKGIINRVGVRQHATLLYFMRVIAEEYNQLELFE